jgi:predicted DNA-binding transcriptional regulator AlpA
MSEQAQNDLMDGGELSSLLGGLSPWTIQKWATRKKNTLPSIKLGWRTRRYDRAEVLAWIAAQRKKS